MRRLAWLSLALWLLQIGIGAAQVESDPPVEVQAPVEEAPPPPNVPVVPAPDGGEEATAPEPASVGDATEALDSSSESIASTPEATERPASTDLAAETMATSEEETEAEPPSIVNMKQGFEAVNGSSVYRISLDLPSFYGIQPKLSLSYNSGRKLSGRAGGLGWLAFG